MRDVIVGEGDRHEEYRDGKGTHQRDLIVFSVAGLMVPAPQAQVVAGSCLLAVLR